MPLMLMCFFSISFIIFSATDVFLLSPLFIQVNFLSEKISARLSLTTFGWRQKSDRRASNAERIEESEKHFTEEEKLRNIATLGPEFRSSQCMTVYLCV